MTIRGFLSFLSYYIFFNFAFLTALEPCDIKTIISEHRQSQEYIKNKWPLLTYAIHHGYREIALHVLSHGVDPNGFSAKMSTSALCQAIVRDDEGLVEALLKHGADPNGAVTSLVNENGKEGMSGGDTPLSLAVRLDIGFGVTEVLLKYGASPNLIPFDSFYPYSIVTAVEMGKLDIVNLLLENGANPHLPQSSPHTRYPQSILSIAAFEHRLELRSKKATSHKVEVNP